MDNKDFKWTDALVAEYGVFYHSAFSDVDKWISKDVLAEFKKSKQPKRDWQIESFKTGVVGKYYEKKDFGDYWEKQLPDMLSKYPIQSVRRLSDNTTWSVGDSGSSIGIKDGVITNIFIGGDGNPYFHVERVCSFHNSPISELSKAPEKPKPLLFEGKVTLEQYIDDPTFPCLFVPEQTGRNSERYLVWDEADLVECKIRGLGSYFKVSISKIDKQQ